MMFVCPWCETAFQDDGENSFDESEVVELECRECHQVFFVRKTVTAYYGLEQLQRYHSVKHLNEFDGVLPSLHRVSHVINPELRDDPCKTGISSRGYGSTKA